MPRERSKINHSEWPQIWRETLNQPQTAFTLTALLFDELGRHVEGRPAVSDALAFGPRNELRVAEIDQRDREIVPDHDIFQF